MAASMIYRLPPPYKAQDCKIYKGEENDINVLEQTWT